MKSSCNALQVYVVGPPTNCRRKLWQTSFAACRHFIITVSAAGAFLFVNCTRCKCRMALLYAAWYQSGVVKNESVPVSGGARVGGRDDFQSSSMSDSLLMRDSRISGSWRVVSE